MRTAFAASLACAVVFGVSAAPSVTVSIVIPPQVNDVDNLSAITTVHNSGTETLKLLNDPRSVLSDAETNTFDISNDNGSPEFTGMLMKYSPNNIVKTNDPADFTVLAPGQSHQVIHNLAGVYNFTNVGPGEYKVSSNQTLQYVDGSGNIATIEAASQPTTFGISGKLVSTKGMERRSFGKRQNGPQFVGCSASQQADITTAVGGAESYAQAAAAYFETLSGDTERFNTWFGDYSEDKASTVSSHFTQIQGDATTTTYDCSTCNRRGVFAYVYPTQPGRVYLCEAFWRAPQVGTDSKAGTIVHEQSHFDVNGGTRDYAYGQSRCRNLAIQSPGQAIMNADSHEYFAENNPELEKM
ncbi:Deuterolysin M35 metalloprotease [Ceratobasidium theobromae]|uniref:Deuterolysin M35 metalloprotease n=1 Tax=Ceratobasidium theobromae TaxID=1582974 RepID=A0A5N5QHV3_9AGAM|nr:Deuterolysin M35 metalloprotease [Ceratobasidium theobromae]